MKRVISALLSVMLVLSIFPVSVFADEFQAFTPDASRFQGSDPAQSVENESVALTPAQSKADSFLAADTAMPLAEAEYQDFSTSASMLAVIKDAEGFVSKPYWDYMQWSIGYGTVCGYAEDGSDVPESYWGGITEEEGERLLMNHVETLAEDDVNYFFRTQREYNYPVSQNQFDAMVDFTYALGSSWVYDDSRVAAYLSNPTTEVDLVRALGAWCRVGGSVSGPTCSRRVRESLIFLDDTYYLPHGSYTGSDLEIVSDRDLPRFKYTIFNGNGVYMINTRTDDVNYYHDDGNYDTLPKPDRDGYTFYGWFDDNDDLLMEAHPVNENIEVQAEWTQLPFTDVSNHAWYSTAVAYCYEAGIMHGTDDTSFSPESGMSRAMMVTTLYRLADRPEVSGSSRFPDVHSGKYYYDAVIWAEQQGIVQGHSNGSFGPGERLDRAQLVTLLARFAEVTMDEEISGTVSLDQFTDADQIPAYARDAFQWALSRGVVSGKSESSLEPRAEATRAQLAKVLMVLTNLK